MSYETSLCNSQTGKLEATTARHIDNSQGKPLCGGNGREPFFWAPEEGEPTCKICQDLAFMMASEIDNNAENKVSNH